MPDSSSNPSLPNEPAPRFLDAGESALVVEFGRVVDPHIHDRVLALDRALLAANIDGVIETVPTYRSLMVHYDPRRLARDEIVERAGALVDRAGSVRTTPQVRRVPVCYEPPHAEDLAEVSRELGIDERRIVEIHSSARYRLYMYGFLPGYAYLGRLPKELEIPRRANLRSPVPTGALIIAGEQVVIAGVPSITGWYMLGRTPLRVFDLEREPPSLFDAGDEIVFEPISAAEYERLAS